MATEEIHISYPPLTPENFIHAVRILSQAFSSNPVTTTLVHEVDEILRAASARSGDPVTASREIPNPVPTDRIMAHFAPALYEALIAKQRAFVVEAGDWDAVAIWELIEPSSMQATPTPAGITATAVTAEATAIQDRRGAPSSAAWFPHHPQHDIPVTSRPLLQVWLSEIEKVKATAIRTAATPGGPEAETYYHLFMLVRNTIPASEPRHRGRPSAPGAVSACVKPVFNKARAEGRKIWLEATAERPRDIYLAWGFRVVGEIRLGENGQGPAPRVYAMVWDPEEQP